jgi:hypothetical protein
MPPGLRISKHKSFSTSSSLRFLNISNTVALSPWLENVRSLGALLLYWPRGAGAQRVCAVLVTPSFPLYCACGAGVQRVCPVSVHFFFIVHVEQVSRECAQSQYIPSFPPYCARGAGAQRVHTVLLHTLRCV